MRSALLSVLLLAVCLTLRGAGIDTVKVSDKFATHLVYESELTYASLSDTRFVLGKLLDGRKNILALRARDSFDEPVNVSVLDSDGTMHSCIVKFSEEPDKLVYDFRRQYEYVSVGQVLDSSAVSGSASRMPAFSSLIDGPKRIDHIVCSEYGIQVSCEDVGFYGQMMYFLLSVKNDSDVRFNLSNTSFALESSKTDHFGASRRIGTFLPRSSYGKLSAAPGEYTRAIYSLERVNLKDDEVLRIYLNDSKHNLSFWLVFSAEDLKGVYPVGYSFEPVSDGFYRKDYILFVSFCLILIFICLFVVWLYRRRISGIEYELDNLLRRLEKRFDSRVGEVSNVEKKLQSRIDSRLRDSNIREFVDAQFTKYLLSDDGVSLERFIRRQVVDMLDGKLSFLLESTVKEKLKDLVKKEVKSAKDSDLEERIQKEVRAEVKSVLGMDIPLFEET